ncbi:NnrU family protein [Bermanella sp. R86510]|uniref:NnrU family protein n=1 Tax=unclassified Bermanella TaxID=2627862 RepID=UPI0037CB021C
MELLIVGLIVFFGMHLVPSIPSLKKSLSSKLGANGYKAVFALVSLFGLVLIVLGYQQKPLLSLPEWTAPHWARHVAMLAVLIAFILLPAAHMKGNIKRFTRHPMLWAIVLWSSTHLWLNGDRASILLFGSFLVYSLFAMMSANARGAKKQSKRYPLKNDIIVVVAGTVVYAVVLFSHKWIAGVPLINA